jgi:hypothetical protein
MMNAYWRSLLGAVLALSLGAHTLVGQGYRAEIGVWGSSLELQGVVRDSLPEDQVPGDGLSRRLGDGTVVTCTPGTFCRWFRTEGEESITVLNQDLRVSAWAGGSVPGLAAHVHLRGRFGTDDFWPQSSQEVDLLTGYLSYNRAGFAVRAGRLYRSDGLGYQNFDGASLAWSGMKSLRVEAFGGWSLVPNVNAPRTGSLLTTADVFAPDDRGFIVGAKVGGRWGNKLSGNLLYQREIRTDRLALYTDRIALDARALLGRVTADVAAEYDLAYEEFNEARVRLSAPIAGGLEISLQGRHYTPFFELWTIWGAFSPVGFNEGRASLLWAVPGNHLTLEAGGAYREYEETDAGADFITFKDYGWRAFGGAHYTARGWYVDGNYRAETGFGDVRYGGDVALGKRFGTGRYIGLQGSATQTFGEFRLGEQVVTGGGIEAAWRLGDLSLNGGGALYRITFENRPTAKDWTQARVYGGISYRFGMDTSGSSRTSGGDR